MALLRGAMGLSAVGIVVFPNHTHYFSFGSHLTKLGNLDTDVTLRTTRIEAACSQMCICSQTYY